MAHRIAAALALLCLAASPAPARQEEPPYPAPERSAAEHGVVSARDPAIRITLPNEAVYVGAVRWPLYNVADAELHAFVEADETGLVSRFYWIQFEGYLPSRPDDRYRYEEIDPETVDIDGYTAHIRASFGGGADNTPREGSDGEAFRRLLAEHGYRLSPWIAQVRYVHLPTPDRRKELMIIYGEDMGPTAAIIAGAMEGEAEGVTWHELTGPLVERGVARINLAPLAAE